MPLQDLQQRVLFRSFTGFPIHYAAKLIIILDGQKLKWFKLHYFSRMNTLIGVPVNVQCSRILFSR